jgi:hypothetical protein
MHRLGNIEESSCSTGNGMAEPFRASPPEAVVYLKEIIDHDL